MIGLETEYAIRFRANHGQQRPTDKALFRRFVERLSASLPTVEARGLEEGYFLANGGAVKFEGTQTDVGLVEGATPECRSPKELITWQRAQDRLFSEVTDEISESDSEFVLIKNNRDGRGNTYGSHENYEAAFLSPFGQAVWVSASVLMFPLTLLSWMVVFAILVIILTLLFFLGELFYQASRRCVRDANRQPTRSELQSYFHGDNDDPPAWLNRLFQPLLVLVFAPTFAVIYTVLSVVSFRPARGVLVGHLISRQVWSGAGWVDDAAKFYLSQKAGACNRVFSSGLLGSRPMINVANILEAYLMSVFSVRRFKRLLARRQRLQVTLADASMCEEAEYMRLATTRLIIDAAESGVRFDVPRFWRPIKVLAKLNRGGVVQVIARHRGESLTAIDIQRRYLDGVRRYVERSGFQNEEVDEILRRWEEILDQLDFNPEDLVGRVDWVTKRFLLLETGDDLAKVSKRMIDLKYHELSPRGYFNRLAETGIVQRIVSDEEVESAMRVPPASTRAAQRGRYIREFAGTSIPVAAAWDSVRIGSRKSKRDVELL